jgi:hypothetical protein
MVAQGAVDRRYRRAGDGAESTGAALMGTGVPIAFAQPPAPLHARDWPAGPSSGKRSRSLRRLLDPGVGIADHWRWPWRSEPPLPTTQGGAMATKEALHRLIDELPDEDLKL